MLDEPTNHLDMHSCDLLIEALNKYEGSLILVSHDRYFISKTATKIWEIDNHEVKEFKGGYEEWVPWKERMARKEEDEKKLLQASRTGNGSDKNRPSNQRGKNEPKTTPNTAKATHDTKNESPGGNKEAKKELQRMQKQFLQLEEKIASIAKAKGPSGSGPHRSYRLFR